MATNKIRTHIYIDRDIKEQAQKLFSQFNISLSDAINLFLTQSVLNKGIPFRIEIPNEETQQAIKEAREKKNMQEIDFENFKEEIKQCVN